MTADSETMTWGMIALAVILILAIFGTALFAVNGLRKGNSRFRRWQFWRRADGDAADTRDDAGASDNGRP